MLQIIQIITNKHKNISSYQCTHSSPNTKKSNKKTPLFQHSQINLPRMKWILRTPILNLSSQSSYKPHQPTLSIFTALVSPFSLFIDRINHPLSRCRWSNPHPKKAIKKLQTWARENASLAPQISPSICITRIKCFKFQSQYNHTQNKKKTKNTIYDLPFDL